MDADIANAVKNSLYYAFCLICSPRLVRVSACVHSCLNLYCLWFLETRLAVKKHSPLYINQ